jgi:hypothetical protein
MPAGVALWAAPRGRASAYRVARGSLLTWPALRLLCAAAQLSPSQAAWLRDWMCGPGAVYGSLVPVYAFAESFRRAQGQQGAGCSGRGAEARRPSQQAERQWEEALLRQRLDRMAREAEDKATHSFTDEDERGV